VKGGPWESYLTLVNTIFLELTVWEIKGITDQRPPDGTFTKIGRKKGKTELPGTLPQTGLFKKRKLGHLRKVIDMVKGKENVYSMFKSKGCEPRKTGGRGSIGRGIKKGLKNKKGCTVLPHEATISQWQDYHFTKGKNTHHCLSSLVGIPKHVRTAKINNKKLAVGKKTGPAGGCRNRGFTRE